MSRLEESRDPDKEQWFSSVEIFNKNEYIDSVKTVPWHDSFFKKTSSYCL